MDCVCPPAMGSRTAPTAWMRETAVSSPPTPSLLPPHLRAAGLSLSFGDLPMGSSHYQHPGNSLAVLRWQGGCTGWASVPSRAAPWGSRRDKWGPDYAASQLMASHHQAITLSLLPRQPSEKEQSRGGRTGPRERRLLSRVGQAQGGQREDPVSASFEQDPPLQGFRLELLTLPGAVLTASQPWQKGIRRGF